MSDDNEMLTLKFVHVVVGRCGECNDTEVWLVAAHESKANAHEHAAQAMLRAGKLYKKYERRAGGPHGGYVVLHRALRDGEVVNELDPGMRADYMGTAYSVESILVLGSVDAVTSRLFRSHRSEIL